VWALDRVHNLRRPHNRIQYGFPLCDLNLRTFDLILARTHDRLSLCQVWRFQFQSFWFYRADRQTESQTPLNALLKRLSSACAINNVRIKERLQERFLTFSSYNKRSQNETPTFETSAISTISASRVHE